MIHEFGNEKLLVCVESLGAEMSSLQTTDGHEYLWQGSAESWMGRSPLLFPVIGGLPNNRYSLDSQEFEMNSHGFARKHEWELETGSTDRLVFVLNADDETYRQYPFDFQFHLSYRIEGSRLDVEYKIENSGDSEMPFSVGGHPGFRCPLEEGLSFNDYRLRFEKPEKTVRYLKEGNLLTGETEPFEVPDGNLPLNHELFRRGGRNSS